MPANSTTVCDNTRVTTREYFERIIKEHQQAINIADQEREKTAHNVRSALKETMKSGDERLEDHITHQIQQVQQALASLNLLMTERDKRTDERVVTDQKRFDEFKESVTARFTQVNEFRSALDDLNKLMATTKELQSLEDKLVPMLDRNRDEVNKKLSYETWNNTLDDWRIWRGGMDTWRDKSTGNREGIGGTFRIFASVAIFIATVLAIISFLIAMNNRSGIDKNTDRISQQGKP